MALEGNHATLNTFTDTNDGIAVEEFSNQNDEMMLMSNATATVAAETADD